MSNVVRNRVRISNPDRSWRRMHRLPGAVFAAWALGGCSVTGSWRAVSVRPSSAPFPLETITLDNENRYTATGHEDGVRHTATGTYRWNGFTLTLMPPDREPRVLAGRLAGGATLVLTDRRLERPVTVTLARVED